MIDRRRSRRNFIPALRGLESRIAPTDFPPLPLPVGPMPVPITPIDPDPSPTTPCIIYTNVVTVVD